MPGFVSPLLAYVWRAYLAEAEQRAEDLADRVIARWAGRTLGVVLLLGVLAFAAVSLYLWLETYWPPAAAALASAGVMLVFAVLAFVVAGYLGRRRRRPAALPAISEAAELAADELDVDRLVGQVAKLALDAVRTRPGQAALAALAAGLLVGFLTRRKD